MAENGEMKQNVNSYENLINSKRCKANTDLPLISYEINRQIKYANETVDFKFELCIGFYDNSMKAVAILDLLSPKPDTIRCHTLRATVSVKQAGKIYEIKMASNKEGKFTNGAVHMPNGLSICPEYKFYTNFCTEPASVPISTAQPLLTALSPIRKMYNGISVKPQQFGIEFGRFTLISSEFDKEKQSEADDKEKQKQFHVHSQVMQLYSVELNRFIVGNLDGLLDGEPLRFHCSNLALESLLNLIYLQQIDPNFNRMLHEILDVAHMWEMQEILDVCRSHMNDQTKQIKDFPILVRWFVGAHKCGLGIEQDILMELFVLAKDNQQRSEQLKVQLNEYAKTLTSDETTELMMKLVKI